MKENLFRINNLLLLLRGLRGLKIGISIKEEKMSSGIKFVEGLFAELELLELLIRLELFSSISSFALATKCITLSSAIL